MIDLRDKSLAARAAVLRVGLRLLLAGLLLAPAGARAQHREPGGLIGEVHDAETHDPVGWVQILLEGAGRSTTSDERGRFRLANVPAGTYTLKAFRIGFERLEQTVRIPEGDTLHLVLQLLNTPIMTEEIVVQEVADQERPLAEASLAVEGRQLRENLGTTIAETLDDEPGISMRSMGPAPARPVLRGLGGERLLVLEDGGRTGDLSATSSDHAVVIDPMTAERIEVVRGPSALVYGSNALGGVVNVVRGYIPSNRVDRLRAGLSLQGESVNEGVSGGLSLTVPTGAFQLRADGSLREGRDVQTPEGMLANTSLSTYNASVGGSYLHRWGYAGAAVSLYQSEYGIPGGFVGAHPNGVRIELERRHYEVRAEHLTHQVAVPRIEARGMYSYYFHQEFESNGSLGTEFGLLSYNGSLIAHTGPFGPLRRGGVGVWGEHRDFAAGGFVFTPASREWTGAAFAFQEARVQRLTVQAGLRADVRRVLPEEERQSRFIGLIRSRTFSGLSGSASATFQAAPGLALGATLMRSLRMPGIEELYSEGPHLAAYSFEIGDPTLGSERGWGAELSARYEARRLDASVALFQNDIDGYIFPRNTGEINFRTLLPIYQQTGVRARMVGGEATAAWRPHRYVTVDASASYVRGTIVGPGEPLPWIPPLKGSLGAHYRRGPLSLGLRVRAAAEQQRLGGFEEPTDGYLVLDASAQYYLSTGPLLHTFDLVVANATDAVYRDHLSRVKSIMPEPGRNVKLLYKVYF